MSRVTKQYTKKAGMPPGALVHIGKDFSEGTTIEIFDYNEKEYKEYNFTEKALEQFEKLPPPDKDKIRWINVDGLRMVEVIDRVCKPYNIHPLTAEDILNTGHRPKLEDNGEYIFFIMKMIYFEQSELVDEQLSILLGNGYIISFGERKGDVFDQIREGIRKNSIRIRKNGADFLAYSLLDAIVDGYFIVLESVGEQIDVVEDAFIDNPSKEGLQKIQILKRELLYMHKSIWPLREVVSGMQRTENEIIKNSTQIYIRDIYDHVIQAIDTTETYREFLAGLMDIYLSSVSNKLNEVMKVLTIISTIFIPLTFIVGVYGMNFKYMPEIDWKWGYFGVLAILAFIAVMMILYFKRKKWF